MKLTKTLFCIGAIGVAVVSLTAQAASLRCNGNLIKVGDSKLSVLKKCGEPVMKDSYCKPVEVRSGIENESSAIAVAACERIDEWTYDPGPGRFYVNLQFERARLESIEHGKRSQ